MGGSVSRRGLARARARWGFAADEIELYGLSTSDLAAPEHLSEKVWVYIRTQLNENRWRPVLDNKWIFANCGQSIGLPVPEPLGLFHPTFGRSTLDGRLTSVDDVIALIERQPDGAVLKPVRGAIGNGVVVVTGVERGPNGPELRTVDGRSLCVEDLDALLNSQHRSMRGYLLEERLLQHPWLTARTGGALSNVRIVTFVPDRDEPFIQAAVVRFGRQGKPKDSWDGGALACPVDLTDGRLGPGRKKPVYDERWWSVHPDSGETLAGEQLPYWDAAVDPAVEAARRVPGSRVVGWDLFLSHSGPRLIEGNVAWHSSMIQLLCGGFLANGMADAWQEAGVSLPDGSRRWMRRHT